MQTIFKFLFSVFLPVTLCTMSYGQSNLSITTSFSGNLTVCETAIGFSVAVKNTSTSQTVYNAVLNPHMTSGMKYITGTLGSSTNDVTLINVNSSYNPDFALGTLAPGATKTVTFQANANCSILASLGQNTGNTSSAPIVKNNTQVSYTLIPSSSSTSYSELELNGSPSYNVLYADIDIANDPATASQQGFIGDVLTRKLKIRNTGFGKLSKMTLTIQYQNYIQNSSVKINGVTLTPTTSTNTYLVVTITDFSAASNAVSGNAGNGDAFLDKDEVFYVEDIVKVISCTPTVQTDYKITWGCDNAICNPISNNAQASNYVLVPHGNSSVYWDFEGNPQLSLCKTATQDVPLSIYNNGLTGNPQADRIVDLNFTFYYNYSASSVSNFKIWNNSSSSYVALPAYLMQVYTGSNYIGFQDLLTTDIDGPGGLEDLDHDGFYDDVLGNDRVRLFFTYTPICQSSYSSCTDYQNGYIQAGPNYKDNCLQSYYPQLANVQFYSYPGTQSIKGPTDLVNGQTGSYEFLVNRTASFSGYFSADGSNSAFTSVIELPTGYTYTGSTVTWIDAGGTQYQFPVTISGTTMTIQGGNWNGKYKMDLTLNCPTTGTVDPTGTLQWNMSWKSDPTCTSCDFAVGCTNKLIYNHCLTCDGYATTSFSVDRTSMGYVKPAAGQYYFERDFRLQQVHRLRYQDIVAANQKDNYRLNAAYEYDTLLATAKGALYNKSYNNAHVEIYYTVPFYPSSSSPEVLEILDAYFTITTPGTTPVVTVCPTSVTPVITRSPDNKTFTYDFAVPSSCKSSFASGDQIDLQVRYRVRGRGPTGMNTGQNELTSFRANHYGLNASSEKEDCQSFGDDMTIVVLGTYAQTWYAPITYNVQSMPISYAIYGGDADDFPNEFRPYAKLRTATYTLAPHYSFAPASITNAWAGKYYVIGPNNYPPKFDINPPSLISGSTYQWTKGDEWPVFANTATSNNNIYEFFTFNVKRDCFANPTNTNMGISITYSLFDYTDNPAYIQMTSGSVNDVTYDVSTANLTINPESTQEGVSSQVSWPVQICNNQVRNPQGDANNTWVALEPRVGNITFTYATDLSNNSHIPISSTYGTNSVLYQIGNIPVNTCKTIQVNASYNSCVSDVVDAIDIYANWSFSGYPSNRQGSDCLNPLQSSILYLRYKTANLQETIDKLGDPLQNVCEPLVYEIDLLSSKYADMGDIQVTATLPDGITYTTGSLLTALPVSPNLPSYALFDDVHCGNISNNIASWNLSNCSPLKDPSNTKGFNTGSLVGSRFIQNKLYIQLPLNLTCAYDPNDPILFHIHGTTNCGDPIDLYSQQKIRINGLDPLDQMGISMTSTPFDQENNQSTVTIVVTNTGETALGTNLPSAKRYMAFIVPAGIQLVTSGITPYAPIITENLPDGSTKYLWLLPVIQPHASITFSFKIKNVNFNTNSTQPCASFRVTLKAVTEMRNALNCANSECIGKATTASTIFNIDVDKGDACRDCLSSFAPFENRQYVLSVWVNESSNNTATTYTNTSATLYFGGVETTLGPFLPKGDIIDGWQRIDTVFTIPANSTTIEVRLNNNSGNPVYFDDVRVHPFLSNMKSYVYDPISLRLWAELDENNYATIYEYDEEGGLIRVKKETERGVMTIRESRTNVVKKPLE
ncbi:MAG: hypothetical protein JWM14_1281 [Chitinophagaceae bacterium]|nr:hypothetical protein [Chitinophagaceae bacterium]